MPPTTKPTLRRRLTRLAILAFTCYALYGCALMTFQDRLIFPRDVPGARNPADPIPAHWEQLTISADDGSTVPAWLHFPIRRAPGERYPVVMFFHGNAEIIDELTDAGLIELYTPLNVAVLLVEFRGYGRAGGAPSEKAIAADNIKFFDLLAARPDIDPTRIVFYGRSLGGGAACNLARERKPAALIMQSCFTSINAMAAKMFVPGFLLSHHFRNDQVIPTLDCPILFMHGTNDTIIPVSHSEKLATLAKRGQTSFQPCDHNDFPGDFTAYQRDIEQFLRANGILK